MPLPSYKNRVGQSSPTVGIGAITLVGIEPGYQALSTDDNGLYFDIVIEDGEAWEIAQGCLYTHVDATLTRGTFEGSSTGSVLSLSGSEKVYVTLPANRILSNAQGYLEQVPLVNASVAMKVSTLYVGSIAAWNTNRTYTLPANAKVGDRVGIMLSDGSATNELIVTAASGDTLNGVPGGVEWSRIFIIGESLIFRCVVENTMWQVENDGRIPQTATIYLSTNATGEPSATWSVPTERGGAFSTLGESIGANVDLANGKITARRKSEYFVGIGGQNVGALNNGQVYQVAAGLNSSTGAAYVINPAGFATSAGSGLAIGSICANLNAGDFLKYIYWQNGPAGTGLLAGTASTIKASMSLGEML